MTIPELFMRRPVMTTLVMSGILLFGAISFRLLPVNSLPTVDYPTIQVSASLPGASPSTMASSVATPLEKQFSTIAGVDSMTSVSAQGLSQITIQFSLERNIDAAAQSISVNKLGRDETRTAGCSDFINCEDVRMIQSGSCFCFLDESQQALLVRRQALRKDLDRHGSIQLSILRQIHLAHSTRANL